MARNQEDKDGGGSGADVTAVLLPKAARVQFANSIAAAQASWSSVPEAFRAGRRLPEPWEELFGPLRLGMVDDLVVVGQIGQSLDGRIATVSGHSHYINGADGLDHLHRLRGMVDAVVIGIGTALQDNPQLTVRRVAGPNPARVVIDPRGRLSPGARLLTDDGADRLVLTSEGTETRLPAGVEPIALPCRDGHIAPAAILTTLARRGFRRIMIEGGAQTVSRFLRAGCLDRVHVIVAPLILGAGPLAFDLVPVQRVDDALHPPTRIHRFGDEILFDCDLTAQRVPVGLAKMST
jgi:diaminohydroxyphosphoribosylaminopyrimidine deaminase / 5-amino-6-(5-phosphoribosylamino)uracil reductase